MTRYEQMENVEKDRMKNQDGAERADIEIERIINESDDERISERVRRY